MRYFISFKDWMGCAKDAALHLSDFIILTFRVVLMGLLSLFRAMWRFMSRQVGKYPSVALGGFLVAVFLVWLLTFASMRARAVGAEEQRDSISYQYSFFKTSHGYE